MPHTELARLTITIGSPDDDPTPPPNWNPPDRRAFTEILTNELGAVHLEFTETEVTRVVDGQAQLLSTLQLLAYVPRVSTDDEKLKDVIEQLQVITESSLSMIIDRGVDLQLIAQDQA